MNLRVFILSICFILASVSSEATDYYSIDAGMGWSSNSGWGNAKGATSCSCKPGLALGSGHLVSIETNVTASGDLRIKSGATLEVTDGDTLVVDGNAQFDNGSSITIRDGGVVIITGDLNNRNNSDDVTINGAVSVAGDLDNGTGASIEGYGEIEVTGSVSNDGTIGGSAGTDLGDLNDGLFEVPLPVVLSSFSGVVESSEVKLSWSTAAEVNNDYFEIQKSENGSDFITIGMESGNGTTSEAQDYVFFDSQLSGEIVYYRLKQVDFDGRFEYSESIAVRIHKAQAKEELVVYPNPISKSADLHVEFVHHDSKKGILLVLEDQLGHVAYSKVLTDRFANNTINLGQLNQDLAPGLYTVIGTSDDMLLNKKIAVIY